MARLIVEQIVSADGCAQDAQGGMGHVPPSVDDGGCDADHVERLAGVTAIVLGARTYRMFAGHWPSIVPAEDLLAGVINTRPKHVVSASLAEEFGTWAPWGELDPVRVEVGDAVAALRRLKHRYTGELVIWGSLSLSEAAFAAGEVDVLRLRIVPTLAGGPRSFTPAALGVTGLELVSCRSYSGGQVMVEYDVGP